MVFLGIDWAEAHHDVCLLDEQGKIWSRLYRGDKSRSQRGLGLGLSLVKAVVEAHGGKVAVALEDRANGSTGAMVWASVTTPSLLSSRAAWRR